jgi:hypothetical protein
VAESRGGGGGRYAIFGEIASGATGSVHLGRLLGAAGKARTVAIKEVYPEFAEDPDFVTTFLDEARLIAPIKHPNIVPTLDIVREERELLVVTEYVAGETLAQVAGATRASGERLDPSVACAIVVGVLQGLHAAHEGKNEFGEALGIVHGAVSPRTVLVGVDGVPRLVDFGVAKALGQMRPRGAPRSDGKLPSIAPEQQRGAAATRMADVWAAAAVLRKLLTGEPILRADGDTALTASVAPALEAIVRKGLERDPKLRFTTAREMAAAIEQALPLATASEVGAWVERTCGAAIAKQRETIHEIESNPARGALPAVPIVPSSEFIADALWGHQGHPAEPLPPDASAHAKGSVHPAELAQTPSKARPPEVARASAARRWGIGTVKVGFLGAVALGAALLSIPSYAKWRAITTAAARGVSVTIDDATGGFGGVTFRGITASVPDVPGAHATLSELEIELHWLRPERATLRHAELWLDGPVSKTLALVALWHQGHDGATKGTAEVGDGVRVVVPSAHVRWSHAFGEDGQIEAADVTGDLVPVASTRIGDEFQFTTSKLTLTSKAGTLGPWRVDLDRDPNAVNLRVAFDPPVPDGPNAMITRMTTGKTSIEVNVPRSPLLRIGVPPSALAEFHQVPDQAEVKLHYARTPDNRVDATLAATLFGVHAASFVGPVDVAIAGSVSGEASGPLDLHGGALTMGSVRATLAGPVVIDDRVRATLSWKAASIPCVQLLPKSEHAATDLAGQLGLLSGGGGDLASLGLDVTALAQSAGFARVSGNLSVSGTLVFDSSHLSGTTFVATGKNSCGISLFGGR